MAKTLTLDEAAQQLGLTPEQFKVNLKTHKEFRNVRPLMGGATMHFRAQDIDELGRRLGLGSEPELQLGDASSDPIIPLSTEEDDEQIEIGREIVRGPGASSGRLSSPSSKRLNTPKATDDPPLIIDDSSADFVPLSDDKTKKDSDAKLQKSSDSDVKLEKKGGARAGQGAPTEEIIELAEDSSTRHKKKGAGEVFELAPEDGPRSDKKRKPSNKKPIGNSEFEVNLGADSSDEFELTLADDGSDEVELGASPPRDVSGKKGNSGVNLKNPADSGISLEKSDSDSEFELNLDSSSSAKISGPKSDKKKKKTQVDSESEFELTLDDSSSEIAPELEASGGEKDIFETDFDIPALDDESASEAVVLEETDTDLESSDFDLALDDSGVVDDSASEVVELEEARPRRKGRAAAADDDDGPSASEELVDVDEVEEEEVRTVPASPAAKAKWGPLPTLVLAPCLLVMFFVTIVSFEMLRSMWGYRSPANKPSSTVTRGLAGMFVNENELPKE